MGQIDLFDNILHLMGILARTLFLLDWNTCYHTRKKKAAKKQDKKCNYKLIMYTIPYLLSIK